MPLVMPMPKRVAPWPDTGRSTTRSAADETAPLPWTAMFCNSARVSRLPPSSRTEEASAGSGGSIRFSAPPPQRTPSCSLKFALALMIRDSICTWRTGTSNCAITPRTLARFSSVSVRITALVRSSTITLPRSESTEASDSPRVSRPKRSAALA